MVRATSREGPAADPGECADGSLARRPSLWSRPFGQPPKSCRLALADGCLARVVGFRETMEWVFSGPDRRPRRRGERVGRSCLTAKPRSFAGRRRLWAFLLLPVSRRGTLGTRWPREPQAPGI